MHIIKIKTKTFQTKIKHYFESEKETLPGIQAQFFGNILAQKLYLLHLQLHVMKSIEFLSQGLCIQCPSTLKLMALPGAN